MYRITVAMRNGCAESWNTESKPNDALSDMIKGSPFLSGIGSDGTLHIIPVSEIINVSATPMQRCPHCGKDMIPSIMVACYEGRKREQTSECPECGAEL